MGLINTEAAAAKLGLSVRRVRAIIASGRLGAQKVGRDWLMDESIVAAFKKQKRKGGRPRTKRRPA